MTAQVLVLIPLPGALRDGLASAYTLVEYPEGPDSVDWHSPLLERLEAVVTNGTTGLSAERMAKLPRLRVVCSMGVGTEKIDIAAAAARGIPVTNSQGANAATVADHAIGMALALARGYRPIANKIAGGAPWGSLRNPRPTLSQSRVGIVGMGMIGRMVAARAIACGAVVGYHQPRPKDDAPGAYHHDLLQMAANSDFLFACCPGGPGTHHLLDRAVFEALGPNGFVINVARGTVLKTADLLDALRRGAIAGAGLDVLEEEPQPPEALLAELAGMENVLLTPHISGRSPAAVQAQLDIMLESLHDGLGGRAPRYAVRPG